MNLTHGSLVNRFRKRALELNSPRVIEFGVKRSIPDRSTMHRAWVPHAREYLGSDFENGLDVDIVADLHDLSGIGVFDVMISCSVLEHVKRPWIAVKQMAKYLTSGGLIFLQTHHTFPLHAYPYDYWRFTAESLTMLCEEAGLEVVECAYEFPAEVHSEQDPNAKNAAAFLNVCVIARRPA